MASWIDYKGLEVPDVTTGAGGTRLKDDLKDLADRAPYPSSSDPTTNDDSGDGFGDGSLWLNTSTRTLWICTSASVGAAKWRSLYRRVDNAIILAPLAGTGGGTDGRALQLDDSGDSRGANAVDLQRTRAANSQVAAGSRAAILGGENNRAFSTNSVVVGGKGSNAGGSSGTISSVAMGNPSEVTSNSHGLISGQTIAISETTTTPTINGDRTVTVTGTNTFTVPVNVTGVTTGTGSWTTNATAAYAFVGGGQNNLACGKWSHAEGYNAAAVGSVAHAEGKGTTARGSSSHAEGYNVMAVGGAAHAEGRSTSASGLNSHAEGYATYAVDSQCHAEGSHSIANGFCSHAEGYYASAMGSRSHAEGNISSANGYYSHAEGLYSIASGVASHAEGNGTASGSYSHSEGRGVTASGTCSHAEGNLTTASASYSHSGGMQSNARLRGQWARAAGGHSGSELGSAQSTITQLFRRTTDGNPTELTLTGGAPSSTTRYSILDGQTLSCLINVVGRKENGGANDHASFLRQVCIRREGSTTQLVDTVKTVGTDINPANWGAGTPPVPVTISADDSNESLKVEVAGATSTNIRWMATVMASEVTDPQ